ncbi:MAG: division/cell wall cluster transcriptional repressor MraZ [Vicinamibacterales bacterium]
MEQKRLRGSAPARIDEKGRLKIPTGFRPLIQDLHGPDVFVTSLAGDSVRIYPMPVWLDVEQRLTRMPANHPARLKFLDRVNYYGQMSEIDGQGRVVVPALLRESASIVGDVRVFGHIDYLEVWNDEKFALRLHDNPLTDDDLLRLAEHGI